MFLQLIRFVAKFIVLDGDEFVVFCGICHLLGFFGGKSAESAFRFVFDSTSAFFSGSMSAVCRGLPELYQKAVTHGHRNATQKLARMYVSDAHQ
jgi:hypothetical protein